MRTRRRLLATLGTLTLTLLAAAAPGTNLARLAEMPPGRRQHLADQLKAFDALPSEEQARIRALDAQVEALEPDQRERYRRLLRSYHLWLQAQSPAARTRVAEAEPDARIRIINDLRAQQRKARAARSKAHKAADDALQVSNLTSEPLLFSALELAFWFRLEPDQRAKIGKLPNPAKQKQEFLRQIHVLPDHQAIRAEVGHRLFLAENGAPLREQMLEEAVEKRLGGQKLLPKHEPAIKKAEVRYLQSLRRDEDPEVSPHRLTRFEDALPPWIRDSFDALPPDSAERRLKILYRVVFPPGSELPEPSKLSKKEEPKKAPPKTSTPPDSSPAKPF